MTKRRSGAPRRSSSRDGGCAPADPPPASTTSALTAARRGRPETEVVVERPIGVPDLNAFLRDYVEFVADLRLAGKLPAKKPVEPGQAESAA